MAQKAEIKFILLTSGIGQVVVLTARFLPSGVPGGKGKPAHTDKPQARQARAYPGYAFRPLGGISRSEPGPRGAHAEGLREIADD
jgi:hypothetical protein